MELAQKSTQLVSSRHSIQTQEFGCKAGVLPNAVMVMFIFK